jgi:hypothetical protein
MVRLNQGLALQQTPDQLDLHLNCAGTGGVWPDHICQIAHRLAGWISTVSGSCTSRQLFLVLFRRLEWPRVVQRNRIHQFCLA